MLKRAAYLLIGVGLIACGVLVPYAFGRYGLPRLPSDGAPLSLITERDDVMIPALMAIIACGSGIQIVTVALLRPSTTLRRIVSAALFVGILVSSVVAGVGGIIGWNSWAQHAFPGDGIGLLPVMPRVLQTFLGFGGALCMLLWIVFLRDAWVEIVSEPDRDGQEVPSSQ